MVGRYKQKNRYSRNTKLSEKHFTDIVRQFCFFSSASQCAKDVGVSRQTVHSVYKSLGVRIIEMFEENQFPNFSSAFSLNVMSDRVKLHRMIRSWLEPSVFELVLLRPYEELFVDKAYSNTVFVHKNYRKEYLVYIYDHVGKHEGYKVLNAELREYIDKLYKNFPVSFSDKKEALALLMSKVGYKGRAPRDHAGGLPDICFDRFSAYRDDPIKRHQGSLDVRHSLYRMLNSLLLLDASYRGLKREKFQASFALAKLVELMEVMHISDHASHKSVEVTKPTARANMSAFFVLYLSLYENPL